MLFEKDGNTLEVFDAAHIDCLKAKGWTVVEPKKAEKPAEQKRTKKEEN